MSAITFRNAHILQQSLIIMSDVDANIVHWMKQLWWDNLTDWDETP